METPTATHRIDYMPVDELQDAPRNPKGHADTEVQKSISRFGYVEPIVLDERTGRLVAGHGRKAALIGLKKMSSPPPDGVQVDGNGRWLVPVLRGWSSESDQEAEAYLLASNRLTEVGGWHNGALAEILAELRDADALEGLGFDDAYLTKLLDDQALKAGQTDPDDVPEAPEEKDLFVEAGDLWVLGEHMILCGDSTSAPDVDRLMQGELADICWTDPPWNVGIGTHSAYGDKKKNRAIANDNLGDKFPAFCRDFMRQTARVMKPGGMLYAAMSSQEWPVVDVSIRTAGFHWSSTIIWAKDRLILSQSDYHRQYEPVWYGWKEGAARLFPLEDRKQSDIWEIARPSRSEEHPTMKPVELVVRSLKNSSALGSLVFEPFSGSGTTLIASEQTGRRCRAIELEPKYVQVAVERWQAFTGRIATKG